MKVPFVQNPLKCLVERSPSFVIMSHFPPWILLARFITYFINHTELHVTFFSKIESIVKGLSFSTEDFPEYTVSSERAIPKEEMQSVLVKGQHHGKRVLQRWMLWCGLYSHRLVKFGRLEINQPLSLPDTPIRLWSTTWYNDINSEDNIKQIQD